MECQEDIYLSGERLRELCAEQELVIDNSLFMENDIYKCTWVRRVEGRVMDLGIDGLCVVTKVSECTEGQSAKGTKTEGWKEERKKNLQKNHY